MRLTADLILRGTRGQREKTMFFLKGRVLNC